VCYPDDGSSDSDAWRDQELAVDARLDARRPLDEASSGCVTASGAGAALEGNTIGHVGAEAPREPHGGSLQSWTARSNRDSLACQPRNALRDAFRA
jgi:hypothetical protein